MQTLLAEAQLSVPSGQAQGPCQKASCPHLPTSSNSQQPFIHTPCLLPSGCSKPGSEYTRYCCTLSKEQGAPTCLVQCTRLFPTRSSTSGARIQYKFSQNTQDLWSFAPTAAQQLLQQHLSQHPHAQHCQEGAVANSAGPEWAHAARRDLSLKITALYPESPQKTNKQTNEPISNLSSRDSDHCIQICFTHYINFLVSLQQRCGRTESTPNRTSSQIPQTAARKPSSSAGTWIRTHAPRLTTQHSA